MRGARGSALVLFLGVMLALSIMSVALVTVLANAQHSTSREKSRTSAFDVAEGAIDVSMQLLTDQWPGEESRAWTDTTFLTREPDFASRYAVQSGLTAPNSLWVSISDDDNGDLLIAPHWDANGNGRVWIDSQARINGVASRVRAMVQAEFYEFGMAKGVVVYTGLNLESNAVGENKAGVGAQDVTIGGPQPVSVAVWGSITDPSVAWPYVDQDPPNKPTRQELISDQMIEDLTLYAQRTGKYFTRQPTPEEFTGLCVVDIPQGATVALDQDSDRATPGNQPFNSIEHPGILLVLGGGELKLGGQVQYYGVVYCAGNVSVSSGNPIIYGMVICEGTFDMGGGAQVIYREDCLARLDTQFQTNTKLVPNYWRELRPLTSLPPAP